MIGGSETEPDVKSGPSFLTAPPAVPLPKGGGVIRGIGEKFAANPATGTGSMSVPLLPRLEAGRDLVLSSRFLTIPVQAAGRSVLVGAFRFRQSLARRTRAGAVSGLGAHVFLAL